MVIRLLQQVTTRKKRALPQSLTRDNINQADLYIRRLGTPADTIQLDLTPPTRHTTP